MAPRQLANAARGADERRGDVDLVAVVCSLLQERAGGVGRRAVAQRPLELARRVRRGVPAVWCEGAGQGYDEACDARHLRPMPELCCVTGPSGGTRADAPGGESWSGVVTARPAAKFVDPRQ